MPKFSDLVAGTRALSEPETIEIAPDVKITVRFRPLAPFESSSVLSNARADAKAAGVETPEAGEPIYEDARAVHTLAFALVDADSKSGDPQPYFDGGVSQIRNSHTLTADVIAYLYELWEQWNDSRAMQRAMLDEATFAAVMGEAAVGNARPFFGLRPGARWNCFRTLAARHVNLQKVKSPSGSGSQESPQQPQNQATESHPVAE